MTNVKFNGTTLMGEHKNVQRLKFGTILYSDPIIFTDQEDDHAVNDESRRSSNVSDQSPFLHSNMFSPSPASTTGNTSPYYFMSPWNQPSPITKSPWIRHQPFHEDRHVNCNNDGLIGSIVREEGHIYSLAASGDLLFTGTDSKNVRVWKNWKNLQEFSGFKSNSGLVKAIIVLNDKVFTGHQDGKIRVWKNSKRKSYKRVGSLPTTKDYLKTSMNPKNYVEIRRNHATPWIKHFDAVSCMSADMDRGLLYSGSWDKTLKVWRLSDSKCLESVTVHDDAVNSVAVGFDGLIFTGSADGTVKVWRRELVGKCSKHVLVETLLKQDYAVTSVAVNVAEGVVYSGTSDGLVNFWEREKHFISHCGVLRGHKLAVLCLATAGNLVLSGSADNNICVWRGEECGVHTCVSVLTGHTGPIKCLAIEQENLHEDDYDDDDEEKVKDGKSWIVYSGSLDKSVKVWRVSEYTQSVDPTRNRLWW